MGSFNSVGLQNRSSKCKKIKLQRETFCDLVRPRNGVIIMYTYIYDTKSSDAMFSQLIQVGAGALLPGTRFVGTDTVYVAAHHAGGFWLLSWTIACWRGRFWVCPPSGLAGQLQDPVLSGYQPALRPVGPR